MRLTTFTDYSLRVLIYVAARPGTRATIGEIATSFGISEHHLTKVVHHLGQLGLVTTIRGRSGGLKLGREPQTINVGQVVRVTETDFHMAECFMGDDNQCVFASFCRLESALARATQAFLAVLDAVTLDQLVVGGMMAIPQAAPPRAIPIVKVPR